MVARKPLTVPVASAIVGGLSWPSKMPCPAWGLSARECKRGRTLAQGPDTVCARCYALRGRYVTRGVETAHVRRLLALEDPLWPEAMAVLIDAYCRGGYFRWFDSGDIQSPEHLERILWVARKTRTVRHWLPTHEHALVKDVRENLPANMTVRLSADMLEDRPARPTWGLPTSTVHRHPGEPVPALSGQRRHSIECRAYLRAHRCGGCRACWEPRVQNVSYLLNAGLRFRSPHRVRSRRLTVAP